MTSFGNPVGKGPEDPFAKYYEIEQIKALEEEERKREEQKRKNRFSLALYILILLKKIVTFLLTSSRIPSESIQNQIRENVVKMHESLKMLMKEDRSQDTFFLKNLSQIWQNMLEHSLQLKKTTPLMIHFKNFIKEIAHYPENQDHSLAYYLSEYAGQSWLPFPYMELIKELHIKYEKDPTNNPLTKWAHSLLVIESLLKKEA